MTAAALVVLWCDRRLPGMTETRACGRLFDHRGSIDHARRAAAARGWTSTGIADFCPDHAFHRQEIQP